MKKVAKIFFSEKGKVAGLFFLVLTVGFFLRVYKLGQQSFIADEYIGANIGYGYHKTWEWKYWDFNMDEITERAYTRASVYYWQVAKTLDFFPPSEAGMRMTSVLWGMIGMILMFFATLYFTKNKGVAFWTALLLAVSISALTFDRKLRMYSMFAPVYFAFSLLLFKFFEKAGKTKIFFLQKVEEKLKVNLVFLVPMIILGFLSLKIHLLAVNIFPILLLYFLIMGIFDLIFRKKLLNRYFVFLSLAILAVYLFSFTGYFKEAKEFFSWVDNYSYFEKPFLDYSYWMLAVVVFVFGVSFLLKIDKKFGIWMAVNFLGIIFLATFLWKRNAGDQYIYFAQYFKIFIMGAGVYCLGEILAEKFLKNKKYAWTFQAFIFLILINFSFFFSAESFYISSKKWSYPNYRETFNYYLNNREGNSAIVARPLTNYYLWGSQSNLISYSDSEKLSLEKLLEAEKKYDDIWVIYTKDTFISGTARKRIEKDYELIKTSYTNDKVMIYRFQKEK